MGEGSGNYERNREGPENRKKWSEREERFGSHYSDKTGHRERGNHKDEPGPGKPNRVTSSPDSACAGPCR